MDINDLSRANLKEADACLVLANKYCDDPDAEDAENIMRVISIKNFHEKIRVIVQLIQYHNKTHLMNIPSWDTDRGDDVVCLAELKLGVIAQSCLAQGFSTLIANLFTMRAYSASKRKVRWQNEYMRGTGMEIYTEQFSIAFYGLTFAEAVELCLLKLHLLLIAIEDYKYDRLNPNNQGSYTYSNRAISINPGNCLKITPKTQGFFVAQSAEEAKIVLYYCVRCHEHVKNIKLIKQCSCTKYTYNRKKSKTETNNVVNRKNKKITSIHSQTVSYNPPLNKMSKNELSNSHSTFDSTGMFHWIKSVPIENITMTLEEAKNKQFSSHIVICLFGTSRSPLLGLRNFVMPLRASNFRSKDLKDIVFICSPNYFVKEYASSLSNFPRLYLLQKFKNIPSRLE
ncbi:hypothetical protein A3Q56_04942, partial [Intoshia linei]